MAMDSAAAGGKLKQVENYVIFHPRECGLLEVFRSLFPDGLAPSLRCTPSLRSKVDASWQAKFTMFMITVLHSAVGGLSLLGQFIELWLNTFNINGGIFKLVFAFVTGAVLGNFAKLKVATIGSADYLSVVGLVDPRTDLLVQKSTDEDEHTSYFGFHDPASKLVADACMMASKLAYENAIVISEVVTEQWKMNLIGVYECTNKYLPMNPTQLYIFTDRQENAEAIVVAFRGAAPFNAYDWSINFDFSWYELPELGRVHVGVMEALGLVDRQDLSTFARLKRKVAARGKKLALDLENIEKENYEEEAEAAEATEPENTTKENNEEEAKAAAADSQNVHGAGTKHEVLSGLSEAGQENRPLLAYDRACATVKELLAVHKNAKVYVTGHSLGGALATMFTAMLYHSKEELVTRKLAAVYTFGQPRVGDKEFASALSSRINDPENRYFRVVYARDLVPRIPYEDLVFQFHHLGPCFFYNSSFQQETVKEQPGKNISTSNLLPDHAAATLEVLQSFILQYKFGNSYKETLASTIFRLVGILFPGVAAHSPLNYVNAVRLGPDALDSEVMPSFENRVESFEFDD